VSLLGSFTPGHDANENLTNGGVHTYCWDAEGHAATVDSVGLTYDAQGRMVEQNRGGSYTQIVYGPQGKKLALMNGQTLAKGFVPLSGGATAVYNASGLAYYRHADWLGSLRLASTPSQTVYYDGAYAPYGENYAEAGTTDRNFTGQNQDTISSGPYPLYDFTYREHHPTWGRWLSPDPAGLGAVGPSNPQSWNCYAYVANNPLALTDPTGLQQLGSDPRCSSDPEYCYGGVGGFYGGGTPWNAWQWTWNEFTTLKIPVVADEWVPPYQVTVTIGGVEYPAGPIVPGQWTWTTIGTGIVFTQTGPTTWTFVSKYPIGQTVGKFVQAGFHAAPLDLFNKFHPGQLDLRDNSLICSAHVAINKNSGGAPGVPTTGDIHLDTVNPYPSWSVAFGPGGFALTALAHGVFDVFRGGLYPGSQACQ
jgi:RHS repeat-associated protein